LESIDELTWIYINLKSRVDRDAEFRSEMKKIGVTKPLRVDGVAHSNGMLGCATAHLDALRLASQQSAPLVVICEDDVEFLIDSAGLLKAVNDFYLDPGLDVLCLTHIVEFDSVDVSSNLAIAQRISTAAAYVLKPRSVLPIQLVFALSRWLLGIGTAPRYGAHDVLWWALQQGLMIFAFSQPRLAKQRVSFSNIYNIVRDAES
jgi:hypothetical protein